MWFLENADGLMWSAEHGVVDDLDHATKFESEELANQTETMLDDYWTAVPDVSE